MCVHTPALRTPARADAPLGGRVRRHPLLGPRPALLLVVHQRHVVRRVPGLPHRRGEHSGRLPAAQPLPPVRGGLAAVHGFLRHLARRPSRKKRGMTTGLSACRKGWIFTVIAGALAVTAALVIRLADIDSQCGMLFMSTPTLAALDHDAGGHEGRLAPGRVADPRAPTIATPYLATGVRHRSGCGSSSPPPSSGPVRLRASTSRTTAWTT